MKTVVIANQKGGVGKTAVACHLAFHFRDRGKKVLFIDLDPQGNASSTLRDSPTHSGSSSLFKESCSISAEQSPITVVPSDSALTDLERANPNVINHFKDNIKTADGFDVAIIDTAPTMGLKLTAALIVADYVLSPIELESYSIQGITRMLQTIFGVQKKYNPDLAFLGMLPNRFNSRSLEQKANLDELLASYAHLILGGKIGNRSSISEALGDGKPVWEVPKTAARAAAQEYREVLTLVENKMTLDTKETENVN